VFNKSVQITDLNSFFFIFIKCENDNAAIVLAVMNLETQCTVFQM